MNAQFVRGAEKPTDIGIGKYREMQGLPEEIQRTIITLREMGYWEPRYDEGFEYRYENSPNKGNQFFWDHKNDTYSYMGAKLQWASLFWLPITSPDTWYDYQINKKDEYFGEDTLSFEASLQVSKIDPNSEVAKHYGGSIICEINLKIHEVNSSKDLSNLPDSYDKKGIKDPEELAIFITYKIKQLEIYIKKFLTRYHKINESANFERGLDPKESMKIGSRVNALVLSAIDIEVGDVYNSLDEEGVIEVLEDWQEIFPKNSSRYLFYINENPDSRDETSYVSSDLDGEWIIYKGKYYKIPDSPVKESVNFERGLDPKKSMNIGMEVNKDRLINMLDPEDERFKEFKKLIKDKLTKVSFNNNTFKVSRYGRPFFTNQLQSYLNKFSRDIVRFLNYDSDKYEATFQIVESVNFERGAEPKRSMRIGHRRNDLFNEIESIPFIEAIKFYPELGLTDRTVLSAVAEMLKVPEEKVMIAMDGDAPIYTDNPLMDEYLGREWEYGLEKELKTNLISYYLIGSSTGEVYVKDLKTDDILYILGTVS